MGQKNFFENRFYGAKEVAALLGTTRATIYLWVRQGKFPKGVLIGDMRRYDGNELNEWLAAQYADDKRVPAKGAKGRATFPHRARAKAKE